MLNFIKTHKHKLEYIPLILISLLLVAEEELEHRTFHISCNLVFAFITIIIFSILVFKIKCKKYIAIALCIVVYFLLIHCKNLHFPKI